MLPISCCALALESAHRCIGENPVADAKTRWGARADCQSDTESPSNAFRSSTLLFMDNSQGASLRRQFSRRRFLSATAMAGTAVAMARHVSSVDLVKACYARRVAPAICSMGKHHTIRPTVQPVLRVAPAPSSRLAARISTSAPTMAARSAARPISTASPALSRRSVALNRRALPVSSRPGYVCHAAAIHRGQRWAPSIRGVGRWHAPVQECESGLGQGNVPSETLVAFAAARSTSPVGMAAPFTSGSWIVGAPQPTGGRSVRAQRSKDRTL